MSDAAYPVYQHYGTNAQRLAFTPSPPASGQPIYVWYESDTNAVYVYTSAWHGPISTTANVTHTGTLTANELVVGNGSADIKVVAATNGQIPIGKTSDGTVTLATITQGSGMTVTNGAAAITLAASTAVRTRAITCALDGSGSALTTGIKADVSVPYACTITGARLLADQSGSIVIDIWKDTYANYPPTVADTITAAAKPTLATATKSDDTTLTGWTTSISAGDTLRFNVDSVSTVTRVVLVLTVTVS